MAAIFVISLAPVWDANRGRQVWKPVGPGHRAADRSMAALRGQQERSRSRTAINATLVLDIREEEILHLRVVEHLPAAEIGRRLGTSKHEVKERLRDLRSRGYDLY